MKWAKDNQTIYSLPLNTINEAHLIYYLDSLPSMKPYITNLIRNDMENNIIKVEDTRTWSHVYNNNIGKKRLFSLKFSNTNDRDVIEYPDSLSAKSMSKRAYLIALIEKDIKDKNFKFPKDLTKYIEENKEIKKSIKDVFYREVYYYIDARLKKGETTICSTDMKKYLKSNIPNLKETTFNGFWTQMFVGTNVVKTLKPALNN